MGCPYGYIKYTPKGGAAELPVSAAINISHQQREFEVDRKFKAHSPSKEVYFDLVTLEGELRLKNYEAAERDSSESGALGCSRMQQPACQQV